MPLCYADVMQKVVILPDPPDPKRVRRARGMALFAAVVVPLVLLAIDGWPGGWFGWTMFVVSPLAAYLGVLASLWPGQKGNPFIRLERSLWAPKRHRGP
jgi:hypothetical protein